MRITLTRNCAIESVHHDAGETLDVGDELGKALVAMRRAVEGWPEPVIDDGQDKLPPVDDGQMVIDTPEVAAVEPAEEQAVVPMAKAKK